MPPNGEINDIEMLKLLRCNKYLKLLQRTEVVRVKQKYSILIFLSHKNLVYCPVLEVACYF